MLKKIDAPLSALHADQFKTLNAKELSGFLEALRMLVTEDKSCWQSDLNLSASTLILIGVETLIEMSRERRDKWYPKLHTVTPQP
ncbi:MAG: hypothetical protein PW789_17100 [Edaphobacter sp.]|uniref:hypothetical protein n=1 Tax=Edaphobacter sp. TaxID=1934404 RepID=UPI00239E00C9|nr:hypothetical protein [Edaphobacter sp.]MDE1178294.1 hypothetical protein [Edaphobacter sp.]